MADPRGFNEICLNLAFSPSTVRTMCAIGTPLSEFAVLDAVSPSALRGDSATRHGVAEYGYVIWGTARGKAVELRYKEGVATAAVIRVRARLAQRFEEAPFRLFVAELPLRAGCASVTVMSGASRFRVKPSSAACQPSGEPEPQLHPHLPSS
jgi:hypothetical protein